MKIKTSLLNYQKQGVDKLLPLKVGALFMDMGTGKTRVALEIVYNRIKNNKIDYCIWLTPCSVKENLAIDLDKHCAGWEKYIGIAGIESFSSSVGLNSLMYNLCKSKGDRIMMIVDESSKIKNIQAIRTGRIIRLSEFCKYKLILNGTPVTRDEGDLFSQFYLLDWKIFGYKSYWGFTNKHAVFDKHQKGKIKEYKNIDYLTERMSPFVFQVKKSEVLELPSKIYENYYFTLGTKQKEYYENTIEYLINNIFSEEMLDFELYQLFTASQLILSGMKLNFYGEMKNKFTSSPYFENYLENPRNQALLNVLKDLEGKTIIYCKYDVEMEQIENLIIDKFNTKPCLLSGKMSRKNRNKSIESFRNSSQYMIANKSVTSFGLNLQFCQNAIYYSNDFDYATRIQSEDRLHRIGQKDKVLYIDLIAAGTMDEAIINCLSNKENMLKSVRAGIDKHEKLTNIFIKKENKIG